MPGDLTTRARIMTHVPEAVYIQWLVLDGVFLRCLTTRSLKLKVVRPPEVDQDTFVACVECLLPELFGKKMLEFV